MYCTLSLTLTGLTIILQPDILFALIHTVLHCKGICVLGLHHILHAIVIRISSVKPLFCRFVLPCQIFLPPIKTEGSTIRQRKILPVKLYLINLYTYHNPKLTLTPYSNSDTLNIVVQREKKDAIFMRACAISRGRKI